MAKVKPAPTIGEKLAELANAIADDALQSDEPQERLDAFKTLTSYYLGIKKLKKPEEDDGESFDEFKKLGTMT